MGISWAGIVYTLVAEWGVFATAARHKYADDVTIVTLFVWALALCIPLLHPPTDIMYYIASAGTAMASAAMWWTRDFVGAGCLVNGVTALIVLPHNTEVMVIGITATTIGAAVLIQENGYKVAPIVASASESVKIKIDAIPQVRKVSSTPKLFM